MFANIIAVRAGDETREDIQTLVNVLKSDEMKEWIASNYEGSVLPLRNAQKAAFVATAANSAQGKAPARCPAVRARCRAVLAKP